MDRLRVGCNLCALGDVYAEFELWVCARGIFVPQMSGANCVEWRICVGCRLWGGHVPGMTAGCELCVCFALLELLHTLEM